MAYEGDGRLPVIYVRGFAGSAVDEIVDDPFYGFGQGSVDVRVDETGEPRFHQFESPMLRLMSDERYGLRVQGDQRAYLAAQTDGGVDSATIWVHRFYDVSATTLARHPEDFSIERAAADLVELVKLVLTKTGAPRVFLVAHSMGGLICRSLVQRVIPDARSQEAGSTPGRSTWNGSSPTPLAWWHQVRLRRRGARADARRHPGPGRRHLRARSHVRVLDGTPRGRAGAD